MRPLAHLITCLLGAGLIMSGCADPELHGRREAVRRTIAAARANGAYRCAPRELALAESHLAFAARALHDGRSSPAHRELAVAERSAQAALAESPKERCNPPPKPPDRDGDGVVDAADRCPDEPEDKDGFADEDGCPDPDNDQDRIADAADRCPNEAEDKDGFDDDDGCPDPDNDRDGVVDVDDNCPDQAGPASNHGCPEPKLIVVTKQKIELKQKVHFATNQSTIEPESFAMLQEVAAVLKSRPEIHLRIEGHTDSRGSLRRNMTLSQERAEAVKQFLVGQGIDATRMEARGFGPTQPIDDNRTARGRENNRRTEFIITSQ